MTNGQSKHILDLRRLAPATDSVGEQAGEQVGAPKQKQEVRRREAAPSAEPKKKKRRTRISKRRLAVGALKLTITLIGAAGFLLLEIPLPERIIGIYFVASVVYALDSQRTFLVALIFLALVAGSSVVGMSTPAENYAVYAFYFLVIGLVAAIREQVSNRFPTDRGNSQL